MKVMGSTLLCICHPNPSWVSACFVCRIKSGVVWVGSTVMGFFFIDLNSGGIHSKINKPSLGKTYFYLFSLLLTNQMNRSGFT